MLDITKQIIEFYLKNKIAPKVEDLKISDNSLSEKKWMIFVTLYKNWEIFWSSWNIIEIEKTFLEELIWNTIEALKDKRFSEKNASDLEKIKIRIDIIKDRVVLDEKAFKELSPLKKGVIVIKKDYNKLAVILPNISMNLISSNDFLPVLSSKLWEDFVFDNYIVYSLDTEVLTDF